jgi:hypothetical protein
MYIWSVSYQGGEQESLFKFTIKSSTGEENNFVQTGTMWGASTSSTSL